MKLLACIGLLGTALLKAQAPPVPDHIQLTADDRARIERKIVELDQALRPLRVRVPDDLLVDAEVYLRAARLILRFDEFYSRTFVDQTFAVLNTGLERARQLSSGKPVWPSVTGVLSRAYRSSVDGTVQPYAVTVPQDYSNDSSPAWLEVVLHGRGATLNEVSFLSAHDKPGSAPATSGILRLEVFGRGNNAYRWAGETDVFEAIESVRKRYRIDPDRIVLRGFSMGGAGAWHIGMHYPDQWAAVEAGAGFVETRVHGSVENPPPYAHIYDALDYALNIFNVPTVGYGGEDDPQLRASVFMREALEREGYHFEPVGPNYRTEDLRALFLVGPKTQHRWHPESKKESDSFISRNQSPGRLLQSVSHFVTYTERYNKCFRTTIDQLARQYERAQVDTELIDYDEKVTTHNVTRLTLAGEPPINRFVIDGQPFPMKMSATFERAGTRWSPAVRSKRLRKSHGLQGPIDDAFMSSFVCVQPSNATSASGVNGYAVRELTRFTEEFARWMRGEVRTKSSRDLTTADSRDNNIVVFGTPITNPVIQRSLTSTPIRWTREWIIVGKQKFDASTHMLSMIYPNPANPRRYLVINSGHTFHEADFKGTNALLYPRVGDWAVTDVRTGAVIAEGVFDRNWQLPSAGTDQR